ncbi:MAG: hypothetical protein ACK55Z_08870 [bacterium]|jgi:hypothetical protein
MPTTMMNNDKKKRKRKSWKNKKIENSKTMVRMISRKVAVKFQVIGMTGKILSI